MAASWVASWDGSVSGGGGRSPQPPLFITSLSASPWVYPPVFSIIKSFVTSERLFEHTTPSHMDHPTIAEDSKGGDPPSPEELVVPDLPHEVVYLAPGPLLLSPSVRIALASQMRAPRVPATRALLGELLGRLPALVSETQPSAYARVAPFVGSGTTACEAMILSCAPPGKVLVLSNGFFGERWATALQASPQHTILHHAYGWAQPFRKERVTQALARDADIGSLVVVHSETSTGRLNPLKSLVCAARKARPGLRVLVDAVSSIAVHAHTGPEAPFLFDAAREGFPDAVAFAANKGIRGPTGISFVAVHADLSAVHTDLSAPPASSSSKVPLSLDVWGALAAVERDGYSRFTPNLSAVHGVLAALAELRPPLLSGDAFFKSSGLKEAFSDSPLPRSPFIVTAVTPSPAWPQALEREMGVVVHPGKGVYADLHIQACVYALTKPVLAKLHLMAMRNEARVGDPPMHCLSDDTGHIVLGRSTRVTFVSIGTTTKIGEGMTLLGEQAGTELVFFERRRLTDSCSPTTFSEMVDGMMDRKQIASAVLVLTQPTLEWLFGVFMALDKAAPRDAHEMNSFAVKPTLLLALLSHFFGDTKLPCIDVTA